MRVRLCYCQSCATSASTLKHPQLDLHVLTNHRLRYAASPPKSSRATSLAVPLHPLSMSRIPCSTTPSALNKDVDTPTLAIDLQPSLIGPDQMTFRVPSTILLSTRWGATHVVSVPTRWQAARDDTPALPLPRSTPTRLGPTLPDTPDRSLSSPSSVRCAPPLHISSSPASPIRACHHKHLLKLAPPSYTDAYTLAAHTIEQYPNTPMHHIQRSHHSPLNHRFLGAQSTLLLNLHRRPV